MAEVAGDMGIGFDPWQDDAGQLILSQRADGSYAASIGGVVLSIPRQVGKTFLIGAIVFALCRLNPGLRVVWTSHHLATNNLTFRKMSTMADLPRVKPHVKHCHRGKGDERIEFYNGSEILFGARSRGFGTGFDDIGVVVIDETQRLDSQALDDMIPTMNASKHPPLYFMIGTPPRPTDNGEAFGRARDEALDGTAKDMLYIEFSADEGADILDRKQWKKANPSYPFRTNETAILRMLARLDPGSFKREALGIWDSKPTGAEPVIDADLWAQGTVKKAPDGDGVFGIRFSADGATAALAGAVMVDGIVHTELIEERPMTAGYNWIVDFLAEREAPFAIDGPSASAVLGELKRRKFPMRRATKATSDNAVAANETFKQRTIDGTLTHPDAPELLAAVKHSTKRKIGNLGGWGFEATLPEVSVAPIEACALAVWTAGTTRQRSGRRESSGVMFAT